MLDLTKLFRKTWKKKFGRRFKILKIEQGDDNLIVALIKKSQMYHIIVAKYEGNFKIIKSDVKADKKVALNNYNKIINEF